MAKRLCETCLISNIFTQTTRLKDPKFVVDSTTNNEILHEIMKRKLIARTKFIITPERGKYQVQVLTINRKIHRTYIYLLQSYMHNDHKQTIMCAHRTVLIVLKN